jgi:glycosyltransferase involved in cell wall biosynthesis
MDDPADLRESLGLLDKFVVLYIGAHGVSHALGRILESAVHLKDQENIRFLFVGEGAEKAELVRRANELRLKNVLFYEPVDKEGVGRFYTLADVCLVPLRNIPLFDSFIPSKMFEIMAMERPIVGSVRGEAADILKRSKGALVVEPEDSKAIAEAILYLYHHKRERHAMGQEGRRFVSENYSRRSMANKYLEVLSEAVDVYKKAS